MIPPPHGGRLVDRLLSQREVEQRRAEFSDLPKLQLRLTQVLDAEKIATGAYSPLEGFMDASTLESVLATGRLPNSLPWPIPVVLTPEGRENAGVIDALRPGDEVALLDQRGRFFALLHLREVHAFDRAASAQGTYGTTDPVHPNVAELQGSGERAVAGRVDLLFLQEAPTSLPEMTPAETRERFEREGWRNVAGYQTRNVPHVAHEQLQRWTLERDDIDALFIHPLVGPVKVGDYRPEVVQAAYEALIEGYYPTHRVLLSTLSIGMRYAGPRAALWLAIVRQNYGCSHYIVGRDQAGVGRFYDPYECHRIFDRLPLQIRPLRFTELFLCQRCGGLASARSCPHPLDQRTPISQTRIRRALAGGQPPPPGLLRPEVARVLTRDPSQLFVGTLNSSIVGEKPSRGPPREAPVEPPARSGRPVLAPN